MNDLPTPETDRLTGVLHTNWNDLLNHARKLERERDEARLLLKAAQSALDAIHLEVGGWIKIMKENTD